MIFHVRYLLNTLDTLLIQESLFYNHKDILITTERNTYTTTLGEREREKEGQG